MGKLALCFVLLCITLALAGCDRSGLTPVDSTSTPSKLPRFEVVAAENFWGSLAAQLAGSRADVHSIIVNPSTDPHSYQPTARDARLVAGANIAIVNGAGYDDWAKRLLGASPASGRVTLDVGALLELGPGANPHRWYFPGDVRTVLDAIAADYERLDPADAAYFARRRQMLRRSGFARYEQLLREIRGRYAGVTVGYSESLFQGLGEALGLKLKTPYSFAKAITEGTDVTAQDRQTVDAQAQRREIAVWVFNSQNVTPDVRRVNEIARERHIPIATITETLSPASVGFQRWQESQLEGLLRALRQAQTPVSRR
ncbi:MAG TPA: zinc ABC transporter substrate-binding protein [Solirubrobacteraceae bacterium]|nr:zinc ABC transporter substrate-binding protein [Solirubrobacteraceae bacterium]